MALFLGAHDHLDGRLLNLRHCDGLQMPSGGQQGGFVEQVLKVGAGKPGRRPRDGLQVDVRRQGLVARVHLQDGLAPADIRVADHHLPVEAARAHQRGVEDVRPVGGRNHDDALVRAEAVHLHQQLVQGLLALVVPAAQAGAALAADGVDFVDEDDAGRVFLRLFKQVADARRAHADEHLHKIGAGDGKERHARFACHSAGEQRLARAGRADEQHALGDARAQLVVPARVFQELHNLAQLLFLLVGAGDVGKGGLAFFVGHLLDLRLAEIHLLAGVAHRAVQALHHKPPEPQHHGEEKHRGQQTGEPRGLRRRLHVDRHARLRVGLVVLVHIGLDVLAQIRDVRRDVRDARPVFQREGHVPAAEVQRVLRHLLVLKIIDDFRIFMRFFRAGVQNRSKQNHQQHGNTDEQRDILQCLLVVQNQIHSLYERYERRLPSHKPIRRRPSVSGPRQTEGSCIFGHSPVHSLQ